MLDKLLRLTWRRLLLILVAWVLCDVLHNAVYALFLDFFGLHSDEPFFFLLAIVVIPLYFVVSVAYTLIWLIRQRHVAKNEKA